MAIVPRDDDGVASSGKDNSSCLFMFVLCELGAKGFQFDIERHLANAKKNQHAPTSVTQSVTFNLSPDNLALREACKVGYKDLEDCYTTDLIAAWHAVGYKPSGNRQSTDLAGYTEEVLDKLKFVSESPYGPVSDADDGKSIFKASFKFAPTSPGRAEPKPTKDADAAIAAAFPGENVAQFIAENPDQCVQFVKLYDEKGAVVKAEDYYDSASSMFGPGAIAVVELMVPFGGEVQYAGSKRTVIPKVVSLQAVVRGAGGSVGGGSAGPVDWQEALRKMDETEPAVVAPTDYPDEDEAEVAGGKRKSKFASVKKDKKK